MPTSDFLKTTKQVVATKNSNGCLLAFAIGTDGKVLHNWEKTPSDRDWSGWNPFGMSAKKLAVARHGDGRCELFCIDNNNSLSCIRQDTPGGSWSAWTSLSGAITDLVAVTGREGRVDVFAIGTDERVHHTWRAQPGGPWSAWTPLPGQSLKYGRVAATWTLDLRLEVFAVGSDGHLWHIWQTTSGGPWSSWLSHDGGITEVVATSNKDGRLEVFAIGNDKGLYHIEQIQPMGQWTSWASLGGLIKQITVEANTDGRLEVYAIDVQDQLYHIWQQQPGGPWSAWQPLWGRITNIASTSAGDGRLVVFAVGQDQTVWHIRQEDATPDGKWGAWERLPAIAVGTVILYKDNNWESPSWTITLDEPPNERHRVAETMFDQATYVAFNLPIGVVMTLTTHAAQDAQKLADLSGCGQCTDLIGTGKPQWIDLHSVNMNDCVSMYFWRNVDLSLGYVELFENVNFSGNCATIFLADWPRGKFMSLDGWYIHDRTSSIRWSSLDERAHVTLAEHIDGTGMKYGKITGWSRERELADIHTVGINDCVSSLRWDARTPMKEIVEAFDIKLPSDADVASFGAVIQGRNQSKVNQQVTLTLNESMAESYTVTTTDSHVTGVKTTFTQKLGFGGKDAAVSSETTWSVETSYSYTHTDVVSRSYTKTRSVGVAPTMVVEPQCTWDAWCNIKLGALPPTTYQTKVTRWYDVPMSGAVMDRNNNNWYRREETTSITLEGNLQLVMDVGVVTRPL